MNDPLAALNIDITNVHKPVAQGKKRYLFKHLHGTEFSLQIDNSSLEVFNTCPRSAEYKLVRARAVPPSPALTYGGAIHEGLEYWYRHRNEIGQGRSEDDVIRHMLDASMRPFDINPVPLGEWRTPDRCQDTLMKYIKHYGRGEVFSLLERDGTPAVEIPFSLPLGVVDLHQRIELQHTWGELVDPESYPEGYMNPDVPVTISKIHVYWTGKIDLAVAMDGSHWIVDHKTTSMLGPTFYGHFELSNQTIGYTWAGEQIFGRPFTGLMVNVIVGRKPTKTGTGTAFERQRFYYRRDQIDEWKQNTLTLVSDFVANLCRNYFPMSPAWCMGKYGKCKYHEVCTIPLSQRDFMLFSDTYADDTWTPLNS